MNHIYPGSSSLEYIPYTYIIGWRSLKVYYFGSESGVITKTAHPSNLWRTYFTSSDLVSQFRSQHGEPDIVKVVSTFETADQARSAEATYLTRINAAQRANWLNQHNSTGKFHTCGFKKITDGNDLKMLSPNQSIPEGWRYGEPDRLRDKKRAASFKRSQHFHPSVHQKKRDNKGTMIKYNNGVVAKMFHRSRPIPQGWVKGDLPSVCEERSKRMMGHTHKQTTKDKIQIQRRSKKWFTNGEEEVLAKECPKGWHPGRLAVSDIARINRGKSKKGIKWFTNGVSNKQFRNVEDVPDGWRPGRTLERAKNPRKPRSTQWFWITDGFVDKQHIVDMPIPTGFSKGKCKIYKGPKKRKDDPTVYKLYHPKHGEVSGTRRYFEEQWGIPKGKFSRIKRVTKKNPYGWRMVT